MKKKTSRPYLKLIKGAGGHELHHSVGDFFIIFLLLLFLLFKGFILFLEFEKKLFQSLLFTFLCNYCFIINDKKLFK